MKRGDEIENVAPETGDRITDAETAKTEAAKHPGARRQVTDVLGGPRQSKDGPTIVKRGAPQ